MLLMSTFSWVLLIGIPVVILVVVIGTKLKDRYY